MFRCRIMRGLSYCVCLFLVMAGMTLFGSFYAHGQTPTGSQMVKEAIAVYHEFGSDGQMKTLAPQDMEKFRRVLKDNAHPHVSFMLRYMLGCYQQTVLHNRQAAAHECELALAQLDSGFVDVILADSSVSVEDKLKMEYTVAHVLYGAEKYQEAYDQYTAVINTYPFDETTAPGLRVSAYMRAKAYAKIHEGDPEAGALAFVDFADAYPESSNAHRALLSAAHLHERNGNALNASALYARIVQDYPGSESAPAACADAADLGEDLAVPTERGGPDAGTESDYCNSQW